MAQEMRNFINITGFRYKQVKYKEVIYIPDDRIEITDQEWEDRSYDKWLDKSMWHVYPSMNFGQKHILSFDYERLKNWLKERGKWEMYLKAKEEGFK